MVIRLDPDLEAVLTDLSQEQGVTVEALAMDALRKRFLARGKPIEPQDEWERRLFAIAVDCGVSLPNSAVSSDGLYD
jgi:hypothetical protein